MGALGPRGGQAGIAEHRPRAVLYSSTTAALLAPAPGAIRFDAPAAGNRPGRHGIWQRPVERRRLAGAKLLVPWSEGGLAEAPQPRADALVVPVPVAPSGPPRRARHRRDHLRREPGEEGARPRPGRMGARAAAGRGAARGRARPRTGGGRALHRDAAARRVPRTAAARARVRLRAPARGLRDRPARGARRRLHARHHALAGAVRGAARRARARRRLVVRHLFGAVRLALDDPAPGYAERALEALAPWRPEAVDRVVAEQLLPRLQSLA